MNVQRKEVGILIFPEVEVLDFTGPFEVFSATRLDETKRREEPSPFEIFILAQEKNPVAMFLLFSLPRLFLRFSPLPLSLSPHRSSLSGLPLILLSLPPSPLPFSLLS